MGSTHPVQMAFTPHSYTNSGELTPRGTKPRPSQVTTHSHPWCQAARSSSGSRPSQKNHPLKWWSGGGRPPGVEAVLSEETTYSYTLTQGPWGDGGESGGWVGWGGGARQGGKLPIAAKPLLHALWWSGLIWMWIEGVKPQMLLGRPVKCCHDQYVCSFVHF